MSIVVVQYILQHSGKKLLNISYLARYRNGILLRKLFWATVRKTCSGDREKLLNIGD